MENEMWRPIAGFEGLYEISNTGKVKSLPRKTTKQVKLLKPGKTASGYLTVHLSKNGISHQCLVHRLVLEAFTVRKTNQNIVNHINGIKSDNRLENLEWVTKSENNKHAYLHLGLRSRQRKLTDEQEALIAYLHNAQLLGIRQIARAFNLTDVAIAKLLEYERERRNYKIGVGSYLKIEESK